MKAGQTSNGKLQSVSQKSIKSITRINTRGQVEWGEALYHAKKITFHGFARYCCLLTGQLLAISGLKI
jgi:hypothetical protein